jgi:hypothetical protein
MIYAVYCIGCALVGAFIIEPLLRKIMKAKKDKD